MDDECETSIIKETENYMPQVTSSCPEERKLARQLRIQRRLKAAEKKQLLEDGKELLEDADTGLLESQVETSENQLKTLLTDGTELVTNVQIASDAREVLRRALEDEASVKRSDRLAQDSEECSDKLEEINKRWEEILQSIDPLSLHSDIEKQKELCDEVLKQKDVLIEELREELALGDDKFEKMQKSQKEDLKLLVERIDKHCKLMKRAYQQELTMIEKAIDIERKELVEAASKKWEDGYKERDSVESENLKLKKEMTENFEEEMNVVHTQHYEEYRRAKIQLEKDIQLLQLELQRVKALCLWNNEKLEYNYQVLKKRDEENILIKSQQKRKINKLQDTVNDLKKRIADTKKNNKSETDKLSQEVKRLHLNILDMKKKAEHFAKVNDKKYHELWEMNMEVANELLDKVLAADRIIHEQQLGLEWMPPDLSLLEKTDLPSFRAAKEVLNNSVLKEDKAYDSPGISNEAQDRLLRHVLQKLADTSGFLIDKKLKELLEPYTQHEQTLIKIDNVFTALGIKNEDDMEVLKTRFVPYCYCTDCSADLDNTVPEPEPKVAFLVPDDSEDVIESDTQLQVSDSVLSRSSSRQQDTTHTLSEHSGDGKDIDEDSSTATDSKFTMKSIQSESSKPFVKSTSHCLAQNHTLCIEQTYVLKALRDFVKKFNEDKHESNIDMDLCERPTVSRLLADDDVTLYWERFCNVFPPEREKLWDGLLLGLPKYHQILEERHKLNKDTEALRTQNAELRKLLHSYLSSKKQDETVAAEIPKRKFPTETRHILTLQNLSFN